MSIAGRMWVSFPAVKSLFCGVHHMLNLLTLGHSCSGVDLPRNWGGGGGQPAIYIKKIMAASI